MDNKAIRELIANRLEAGEDIDGRGARPLLPGEAIDIVEEYSSGRPIRELTKMFRISNSRLYRIVGDARFKHRGSRPLL